MTDISNQATLYSRGSQECERIKSLLENIGIDVYEVLLGDHFNDKQFHAEFGLEATYPQISIGYKHIGSMKETLQYLKTTGQVQ
tara:strand:+ start:38958 stop:39209 length:252 start_codon:yes stop_codon:yes gene_type:complete